MCWPPSFPRASYLVGWLQRFFKIRWKLVLQVGTTMPSGHKLGSVTRWPTTATHGHMNIQPSPNQTKLVTIRMLRSVAHWNAFMWVAACGSLLSDVCTQKVSHRRIRQCPCWEDAARGPVCCQGRAQLSARVASFGLLFQTAVEGILLFPGNSDKTINSKCNRPLNKPNPRQSQS